MHNTRSIHTWNCFYKLIPKKNYNKVKNTHDITFTYFGHACIEYFLKKFETKKHVAIKINIANEIVCLSLQCVNLLTNLIAGIL